MFDKPRPVQPPKRTFAELVEDDADGSVIPAFVAQKLFVYFVGASPAESPEVSVTMDINFTKAQKEIVKVFYCPGGINYDNMGLVSKLAMKMLIRGMKAKKNPTENDLRIIKTLSQNYDISDKKYVNPIIEEIQ